MKKVAVNTAKSFLKEHTTDDTIALIYHVGESDFDVSIKTRLSLGEKSVFINRVLSGCFDAIGQYRPEYFEPMFHATVIQMCTNLPVLSLKNEGDQLDIEAMDGLYQSLNLDGDVSKLYNPFSVMVAGMKRLCEDALEWRKEQNRDINILSREIQTLIDAINTLDPKDIGTLLGYAKTLSENTEKLGRDNIVEALIQSNTKEESE